MSRILLVDDSPHAQRMGERILSDEGYEVVTVSNADSALIRLDDVDPDVVLADTVMPGRTGYEICQYIKMSPRHKHVRVILTAGVLEELDDAHAKRVEADSTLKKPFEATALLGAVKPLAEAAVEARAAAGQGQGSMAAAGGTRPLPLGPFVAVVDGEQVKAAVTVALDAAMEAMVEEITRRVLTALQTKPGAQTAEAGRPLAEEMRPAAPLIPEAPRPAAPPPGAAPSSAPRIETVRRVNPLLLRSSSILGLDIGRTDQEPQPPASEPPAPDSH